MENLLYHFSEALGITVIHSLWQGLMVWLLLRILFLSAPSLSSSKKHFIAFIALLSISAWFSYTFYQETQNIEWAEKSTINIVSKTSDVVYPIAAPAPGAYEVRTPSAQGLQSVIYNTVRNYLPYIALLYAVGLAVNLINLALSWNKIWMIRKSLIPASNFSEKVIDFSRRLGISINIPIHFSELIDIPCVIGFFKPILLFPFTLSSTLSEEQIEAIILHELSHIRNNDYLLNVIQQTITLLLFFNPFIQFINQVISTERENKCDDMVIATTGSPLIYAHALLKLEETRKTEIKLALAATQGKYRLMNRIERMLIARTPVINIRHLVFILTLFIISLASISWLNPDVKRVAIIMKNVAKATHRMADVIQSEKKTTLPVNVVKQDTRSLDSVSSIRGIKKLGKTPLVIIDGKEYDPDILYKMSAAKSGASYDGLGRERAINKYGERAKDGAIEITTRTGKIFYMDDTERRNIKKIAAATKEEFITRIHLHDSEGKPFDHVIVNNTSGGSVSTDVTHDGKIGFLVDGKVYSEDEFHKLGKSRLDELKNSKSSGVGEANHINIPGLDLTGYEALFFFTTDMSPLKRSVITQESTMASPTEIQNTLSGSIPKEQLEIIKKMSGVNIDEATGRITAHDQTVTRIKVNGREYFPDERKDVPVSVTSIPRDAVPRSQPFILNISVKPTQ